MSAKTKIVVLHRKQLLSVGLTVLLIIGFLLFFLLASGQEKEENPTPPPPAAEETGEAVATASASLYIPGLYTTQLIVGGQTVDVEVILSADAIDTIRLNNLSDTVTTMYPLLQPTFEEIYQQVLETQSVENITYSADNRYTSLVLLEAIRNSVEKGTRPTQP